MQYLPERTYPVEQLMQSLGAEDEHWEQVVLQSPRLFVGTLAQRVVMYVIWAEVLVKVQKASGQIRVMAPDDVCSRQARTSRTRKV